MLENLTIFSPGGLVLYRYSAQPSLLKSEADPAAHVLTLLNQRLIHDVLLNPHSTTYKIADGLTFSWKQTDKFYVVAVYPDIIFDGPRLYLKQWAAKLVKASTEEFSLFFETNSDGASFDATFQVLLNHSKTEKQTLRLDEPVAEKSSIKSSNKKERHWDYAKVTEKSMAELNMNAGDTNKESAYQLALQEARQAYLPTAEDKELDKASISEMSSSWSASISGLWQQLTNTNRRLTNEDLEKPLAKFQELLETKNVASSTAKRICDAVRNQLVNRQLKSFYSVQTAVQQAMEQSISKLLKSDVDLMRKVKSKRPYVICVIGINGIGKTTTLAKLAYYFKSNKLKTVLVAGDTFRAGAVEQIKIHGDCLDIPVFSVGYAKDPSAVVQQALKEHRDADVILIDTAGRMQTNAPLLKALEMLVRVNPIDYTILVLEALVGNDGISQYEQFSKCVKIDGVILTKFDTVDTKVGAALTLSQTTNIPILFIGVGQKYHHLQKLDADFVVRALLS